MAIRNNRAEGGSAGTTVTQGSGGNSGGLSGDFFEFVVIGTSATLTFNATAARNGALGYRIAVGTTTSYLRWDITEAGPRAIMRRPVRVPSGMSGVGPLNLGAMRNTANGLMSSMILRDRKARIAPAGTENAASESPSQMALDTTYWWEMACTKGTTTSNGRVEQWIFNDDGTLWHTYDTGAAVNTTTTDPGQFRFGGFLSSEITGWANDDMDDLRAGIWGAGPLGPIKIPDPVQPFRPAVVRAAYW